MMMTSSGIMTGAPEEHLIFINIILGKILKFLYTQTTGINWYSLFLYFTHFASSVTLLYCLMKREYSFCRTVFFTFLFLAYEVPILMLLQFTTTAFVAGQAGILLFITSLEARWKKSWGLILISLLLLAISSLIREHIIYLILILAFPLLLLIFIDLKLYRIPLFGAILLLVCYIEISYDKKYYHDDPEWKYFSEYSQSRWLLTDTQRMAHTPEWVFRDIGWSENDKKMISYFSFADRDVYSMHNLKYIIDHSKIKIKYFDILKYARFVFKTGRPYIIFCILNVAMAFVFISGKNKKYIFATCLAISGLAFYFFYIRRLPLRVLLPMTFFINVLAFYYTTNIRERFDSLFSSQRRFRIIVYLFMIVFAVFLVRYIAMLHDMEMNNKRTQAVMKDIMQKLVMQKDKIIVLWGGSLYVEQLSPFSTLQEYKGLNLLWLGCSTFSPIYWRMLRKYNIENPYKALYQNKNMLLVCYEKTHGEYLKTFIYEHYHQNVKLKPVFNFDELNKMYGEQIGCFQICLE